LLGLAIPCITATAALLGNMPAIAHRPFDWMMLAGGAATAAIILATTTGGLAAGQEIIFVVSLTVAALLLWRVARELDPESRRIALSLAVIIFAFRATPSIGAAYNWYSIDVLGFDEPFFGRLAQLGSTAGLLGLWITSRVISRNNQIRVLLVLILVEPLLALPSVGPIFGLHHWTEAALGIGARELAQFDTWLNIRFSNLGMIAMLTLTAFYAPPGRTATWFTLMASIMNLALVAGQLLTKYLNVHVPVDRGAYDRLPELALVTLAVGTIVPWLVAMLLGRRLA
jgi:hypothetical protein